jgi:hypothetical protein
MSVVTEIRSDFVRYNRLTRLYPILSLASAMIEP